MLCEWFLKQFWYFIAKQGLLDEQDIFILEESFTEVTKCSNWFAFELTTLIIPSTSFLVIKGLSLNSILIASTFVLFPFPIFYAFAKVICWFWATTMDERFRNFLQGLRQKELCLFSLQHSPNNISNSIGFMLPLRKSRLNCFKQLRTFIQNYNLASKQFTITNSDRENLLFNFIGDEMHNLVCSDDQECTEEGIEEKLGTSVLKTLWQFMFLVRSEFLRLSILKLQNDICHFHPIDFIQHFYIFLRTILTTSSLNINTNCWEQRKTKSLLAGGTQIKITQFKFCRAQMEWALERLELLDEICASGEEEEESFLIKMGIIGCLEQIIQRLKNDENVGKSKIQTIKNCHERLENYAKNNEGIVGMDLSEKMEQENLDDFKIYEVDLAQNEAAMEKEEENEKIEKENATSSLFFPFGAHNAVQNELRHALCQRKDYCLQRELTALARLRGISPSEIAKEELDRTPFSASVVSHSKTNSAQNERHPSQINHGGPFGRASLNSSDLNLILSQRLAMFGTDDEKTAAQPKNRGHHHRIMLMEAYGENDSEEENEEEDENR